MQKKVFVCGFSQESNSFNLVLTDYDVFEKNGIFEGGKLPEGKTCLPPADWMLKTLLEAGVSVCCGVIMRAGSGGPVRQEVVDRFLRKTIAALREEKPDGVAVAMHGATVSDKIEDVCGTILETIRQEVGPEVPISASFDLHANITAKIAENANFVTGFQRYPHLDQVETGVRAARRLLEALNGEKLFVRRAMMPMIAPAS
ncbi:MAG: M81 family metallopeptidase, partial [Clostridia bacterium]|nr:M81 family metallopeptidase [Clostridia bacterium]